MDLNILKAELDTDPESRGYVGMSDEVAAVDLNTIYRTLPRETLTGSEVFNAINKSEFNALSTANQQLVWDILHLGEINPFGLEADLFTDIFGASTTITALGVVRQRSVSRGVELGLGFVGGSDVTDARALA